MTRDRDDPDTESPMLDNNIKKLILGGKFKQYVVAVSVSLGAVCAGTSLSWTSPVLDQLAIDKNSSPNNLTTSQNPNTTTIINSPNSTSFQLNDSEAAIIGGMLAIGALIAAIPAGYLADKFGRKKIILAISLTFLLSYLLIIFAQNAATLIVARLFAGMGVGAICVTAPMYVGEIAETAVRGILGSFFQLFLCSGILFTVIIGAFTTWTVLSIVLAVIPLIFGMIFVFMPETPAYLVKVGKLNEAEINLRKLRRYDHDIAGELRSIQDAINEAMSGKTARFTDIFMSKGNRRALISAVGVLIFQQFSGINAVVFYTAPIFKAAGSSISPSIAAIIVGIVQVTVSYISVFIIEKANRKFYLMISSGGMLVFLTTLAIYFHLQQIQYPIDHIGFIPIGSAVLFMISFSVGYGPIPWMLLGELFAPEVKGIASGIAILANWLFAFIVTFFFPIVNNSCGPHVMFYLFAIVMGIATVYVYFIVPETRGKTFSEIQTILNE